MCIHRVYMARLYYRIKINGKWNWKSVPRKIQDNAEFYVQGLAQFAKKIQEEEEE